MEYKIANVGKVGILKVKKSNAEQLKYRPDLGDVELDLSSESNTNTTGQFNTVTGGLLESCVVDLEPIQDLHGYDKPWVGGSGKNLIPMTVDAIKSTNTAGTWSGNTYSLRGCEVTINTDDDGNIVSFTVNRVSTSTSNLVFYLVRDLVIAQESILNGCPSGGSDTTYRIRTGDADYDYGSGVTIQPKTTGIYIRVEASYDIQNVTFYPMLRLATVTDATFEPYTNICGITGHTAVEVWVHKKNLFELDINTSSVPENITYTDNGDGTVTVSSTAVSGAKYLVLGTYTVKQNQTIKLVGCPSGGGSLAHRLVLTYSGSVLVSDNGNGVTYTNESGSDITVNVSVRIAGNYASNNLLFKPMISTDMDVAYATFEPYQGQDVTVNLGGTYYGGTLDVVSGVLTVDKGYIEFDGSSDEGWGLSSVTTNNRYYFAKTNVASSPREIVGDIISSYLPPCSEAQLDSSNTIWGISLYNTGGFIEASVPISVVNRSVSDFKTYLSNNPLQVCYALATPFTIQLTPQQINTLIGENNIDVPLEGQSLTSAVYRELFAWDDVNDVVKAVDDKNADVSAIGTDESGRTTASKAYSVGEHFLKDGKFCTAIASISSGATLTLNTNYVEGTIADAIRFKDSYITMSSGITYNNRDATRYGQVVNIYIDMTAPSNTGGSSDIVVGTTPFKPFNNFAFLPVYSGSNPYEIVGAVFIRNSTGEIVISKNSNIPSGARIYIMGTYVCQRQ